MPWVKEFFLRVRLATELRTRCRVSATKFQASFKMFKRRTEYLRVLSAIIVIQRIFRGFRARVAFGQKLEQIMLAKRLQFFNTQATTIQRYYRGYRSRLSRYDFRARQRYIDSIKEKGDLTVKFLQCYQSKKSAKEEQEILAKKLLEESKMTASKHHLVSTKAIRGVLNPPFPHPAPKLGHLAFEEAIKQEIKKLMLLRGVKDILNFRPPKKLPPVAENRKTVPLRSVTADVGRRRPVQGPFKPKAVWDSENAKSQANYSTIQSTGEYESDLLKSRIERKCRIGGDFVFRKPTGYFTPALNVHADSAFNQELHLSTSSPFRRDIEITDRASKFRTSVPSGHQFHDN
jgi:IQ calmodulin-binding motif